MELWKTKVGDANSGSLWDWRNCWLMNLMFRTCARFIDVSKLKRKNFVFKGAVLEVFFQFRKNDQRGEGHTVKILESGGDWCFVKLTKRYLEKLNKISTKKGDTILPKIVRRKTGTMSIFPGVVATDNSCRNAFYDSLRDIGIDSGTYGLHSAKIGGVVHLRNSGVSWRSINDYVGWAKDSGMPERYAKAACNETDKMDNILSLYAYHSVSWGLWEA